MPRALVSVYDKTGVAEFCRGLVDLGYEIVSTGATARHLREAGVPVTEVSSLTGFPEILGGRVKTLHPAVHAGILADRANPEHQRELEERGIVPFDLVVVNLYPFREAVARGASEGETLEMVDIGGPAMLRAAAKNHRWVGVVTSPGDYAGVLEELRVRGSLSSSTRRHLAARAFAHTASYDSAIARWLEDELFPERLVLSFTLRQPLRYGENPHQRGALYTLDDEPGFAGSFRQLQGKELSFVNMLDAEGAWNAVLELARPACVIVKHTTPCGAALGASSAEAYSRALASDPVSAYGGIVAFNVEVDGEAATRVAEVFTEVVVAPGFSEEALGIFSGKKNLRLLLADPEKRGRREYRGIDGGLLVQEPDRGPDPQADMRVVTRREPSPEEWGDLLFAMAVCRAVKSNAIVLARERATVGVGAGQMSRVDSVKIAGAKAGERSRGAVMASDAFFPFRDGVDAAAEAGVTAVIQPGGSVRDEEVIAAADEHGMAMVFTGRRHFRH